MTSESPVVDPSEYLTWSKGDRKVNKIICLTIPKVTWSKLIMLMSQNLCGK